METETPEEGCTCGEAYGIRVGPRCDYCKEGYRAREIRERTRERYRLNPEAIDE